MTKFLRLALLAVASPLLAASEKGYVVRVDSGSVWIDLSAFDGAAVGRRFEAYEEGAELRHPATGALLGRVANVVATGEIREVAEQFSVGVVAGNTSAVHAGQRVRLVAAPVAAPVVTTTPTTAGAKNGGDRGPVSRSPALGFLAVGVAVGDFDGSGKPQAALAGDKTIQSYALPISTTQPLARGEVAGTGVRVLGLSAGRLDGEGKDSLFAAVYDDVFRRFETRVYKLEGGAWKATVALPFLTRSYQDAAGKSVLATQQVADDKTFPFGAIYPLVWKDGRYSQGKPALHFPRVEWLFGFNGVHLGQDMDASVLFSTTHGLRLQIGKDHWRSSDDDYGQTPIRVRWQERMLEFPPETPAVYKADGTLDAVFLARNFPALGGFAGSFGVFKSAELVRKHWDGLALVDDWRVPISGCVQGVALVDVGAGRKEVIVAIRGSTGQTSVWTFDP